MGEAGHICLLSLRNPEKQVGKIYRNKMYRKQYLYIILLKMNVNKNPVYGISLNLTRCAAKNTVTIPLTNTHYH